MTQLLHFSDLNPLDLRVYIEITLKNYFNTPMVSTENVFKVVCALCKEVGYNFYQDSPEIWQTVFHKNPLLPYGFDPVNLTVRENDYPKFVYLVQLLNQSTMVITPYCWQIFYMVVKVRESDLNSKIKI